jgi:hypothetical protein
MILRYDVFPKDMAGANSRQAMAFSDSAVMMCFGEGTTGHPRTSDQQTFVAPWWLFQCERNKCERDKCERSKCERNKCERSHAILHEMVAMLGAGLTYQFIPPCGPGLGVHISHDRPDVHMNLAYFVCSCV